MTAKETVKAICEALIEKKAQGIEVLHVERLTELTEYFVICSASSTTQVKALADNVEWHLKYDHDEMPHHTEGYESAQWMLLDYGCEVEMNPDKEAFRERALPTWSIFTDQYGTELVDLLQQTQGD